MPSILEDQDLRVRAHVYDVVIASALPPSICDIAQQLGLAEASVVESLERLAAGKALVLQGDSREILMASPFSAVPTPFAVYAKDRLYYGNCIWDALGIPAMLRTDARIDCSCSCCGESMKLFVNSNELAPVDGIIHFAVPAHRWRHDIVYT